MNRQGMDDSEKTLNRTGLIHIAFSVGSKEKLMSLPDSLRRMAMR